MPFRLPSGLVSFIFIKIEYVPENTGVLSPVVKGAHSMPTLTGWVLSRSLIASRTAPVSGPMISVATANPAASAGFGRRAADT